VSCRAIEEEKGVDDEEEANGRVSKSHKRTYVCISR
jgi:hypothetical protein